MKKDFGPKVFVTFADGLSLRDLSAKFALGFVNFLNELLPVVQRLVLADDGLVGQPMDDGRLAVVLGEKDLPKVAEAIRSLRANKREDDDPLKPARLEVARAEESLAVIVFHNHGLDLSLAEAKFKEAKCLLLEASIALVSRKPVSAFVALAVTKAREAEKMGEGFCLDNLQAEIAPLARRAGMEEIVEISSEGSFNDRRRALVDLIKGLRSLDQVKRVSPRPPRAEGIGERKARVVVHENSHSRRVSRRGGNGRVLEALDRDPDEEIFVGKRGKGVKK